MDRFEIYFMDLSPEKQKAYLEFQNVKDSKELNPEINPICILEKEDEDPNAVAFIFPDEDL